MDEDFQKRFNINISGKGQPMLFVHGLGCDQNVWRFITPSFTNDYQIILYDQIGSGNSDLSEYDREKYSSLDGYAKDLIDIMKTLGLKDVIVVTHSVGAMIGVLAAIAAPELIGKLLMLSPSPCYINDRGYNGGFVKKEIESLLDKMKNNFREWAHFFTPKIMGNPDRPHLANELRESFCKTDPTITQQFAAVTFLSDNRSDLPRLKVPALIVQCTEDVIAPVSVGEYMQQTIPSSTLKMLKAHGHCPHLSSPEEIVEIMKDYLAKN